MIKFKICGIKFKISFLFIFFISWLLIYGNDKIAYIYLISLIFHEIMHILTLTIFYVKPKVIYFSIYGLSIKKEKELPLFKEFIVLVSGCFGNLVIFTLALFFNLHILALVNLCIFVFNMIPLEKLDGGQILQLVCYKFLKYETSIKLIKITSTFSQIFILTLLIFMFKYFKNILTLISLIIFIISSYID